MKLTRSTASSVTLSIVSCLSRNTHCEGWMFRHSLSTPTPVQTQWQWFRSSQHLRVMSKFGESATTWYDACSVQVHKKSYTTTSTQHTTDVMVNILHATHQVATISRTIGQPDEEFETKLANNEWTWQRRYNSWRGAINSWLRVYCDTSS